MGALCVCGYLRTSVGASKCGVGGLREAVGRIWGM